MNTYEEYLKHPAGYVLTIEDALRIYTAMTESFRKCTAEDKLEFWEDFAKKACNYAKIRQEWEWMNTEKKMAEDAGRTRTHNACIDALNILARRIASEGIDTSWREELGQERKRIGDFACFVAYITGISNR